MRIISATLPEREESQIANPWLFLGGVALGGYVRLASELQWPFPQCWLRKLTGIPCPACGCTRSLLAWSQFDLAHAFCFNPLFFLGCLVVVGWTMLWATEKAAGRAWLPRLEGVVPRRSVWKWVALLVGLNWLYLCLELPK